MKITKSKVVALKPSEKDKLYWDDSLAGFGIKVTPKGKKSYVYQYRLGGRRGRTKRVSLGVHGAVTTEQARRDAVKISGQVAQGIDVAEDKRKKNTSLRLSEVMDVFFREHVNIKLKLSTQRDYEGLVRLHIKPALGNIKIDELNRSDIARFHNRMKNTPYYANRALALLSKLMSWSEGHGYRSIGSNPCIGLEKYHEKKRERFLNDAELHKLGMAITKLEESGNISEYAAAAIHMLLFTGCRLQEILKLKWDEVDDARGLLRLTDTKTGQRNVIINASALEVLQGVKRIEGNPYVFCGHKPGQPIIELRKSWKRVCMVAEIDNVRLHDLRHTHASVAIAAGYSLPVIGSLLGHTQPQTTARYSHLSESPARIASESVGEHLNRVMSGKGTVRSLKTVGSK